MSNNKAHCTITVTLQFLTWHCNKMSIIAFHYRLAEFFFHHSSCQSSLHAVFFITFCFCTNRPEARRHARAAFPHEHARFSRFFALSTKADDWCPSARVTRSRWRGIAHAKRKHANIVEPQRRPTTEKKPPRLELNLHLPRREPSECWQSGDAQALLSSPIIHIHVLRNRTKKFSLWSRKWSWSPRYNFGDATAL